MREACNRFAVGDQLSGYGRNNRSIDQIHPMINSITDHSTTFRLMQHLSRLRLETRYIRYDRELESSFETRPRPVALQNL